MKKYNQAPLPFQGQKRRFVKKFKEALNDFEEKNIYVDLFGGSGLLAHTVKQHYPKARVLWNDYDNYRQRLETIPETNKLLAVLRELLKDVPLKKKVPEPLRKQVLNAVACHEAEFGRVDYITISASLLFSAQYATCYKQLDTTIYNRVRKTDFDATGYLSGVKYIRDDYKDIFAQYSKYPDVVWLVDPPYLSTDTSTYGNDNYWKLRDYLDVLNVIDGNNYFYFTSNKSQVVELCQWMETRTLKGNPFSGANVTTTGNKINYNSVYTDMMLYKKGE